MWRSSDTDRPPQEVFMGDFPLMTDTGTFIINGAERVIVSQLVRSPGVYYGKEIDTMGNRLYESTVIPNRGAWIELETDASEVVAVRIDRNRKLPATVLVRALGWDTNESILDLFWNGQTDEDGLPVYDERIVRTLEKDTTQSADEALVEIYKKLRPGEPPTVESARNLLSFNKTGYKITIAGSYYERRLDSYGIARNDKNAFKENSGRNHQNHIFCDQHPDYHPNPYEKQHKAEQLFQFFCTFFIGLL